MSEQTGPISVDEILPKEWLDKVEHLAIVLEEMQRLQEDFNKQGFGIEINVEVKKIET
jgi:hypothetical protein